MSKNLTRKSFALGALVALASSLFAGSAALAADTVVLAANSTDKTLATTIDGTLTLNASLAPGSTAANIAQLKYKIVTDGTFTVRAGVTSGNARNNVYTSTNGATGADSASGVGKDLWNTSAAATSTSDAKRETYVTPGTTPTATYANTIAISVDAVRGTNGLGRNPISTDATRTITVTAFIDSNLNSLLDTGEATQEVTVSFIKYSAVTVAGTVTSATEGDTSVSVSYKYSNINNEQLTAANAGVYVTNGLDADFTAGTSLVSTGAAYSTTADAFRYIVVTPALAKSSSVKVQALLGSATISGYNNSNLVNGTLKAVFSGTAITAGVTNRALSSLAGNTVLSTTASAAAAAGTSVTQDVALNAEKQVYFIAKDNATTPAAKAGQVVKVTVTAASLSATKTLTVNGTTYTDSTKLPGATGVDALSLTTDAAGKVTITYKTVGFATAGTVKFSAVAENYSAAVTGTERTLEYATNTYIANSYSNKATAATFATTDGTAVKVDVVVLDQFGGAAADATYQVTATASSQGQATAGLATAGNTYLAVTGGKASLSILDGGTGVGTNVYSVALQPVAANGNLGVAEKTFTVTIKVVAAADAAVGELAFTTANTSESATTAGSWSFATTTTGASDATTPVALTYSDFKAVDLRNVTGTAPNGTDFAGLSTNGFNLAGTAKSATTATYAGVVVPNAAVTVSGAGLMFATTLDTNRVFAVDSITTYANASGVWAIDVWSHIAGKAVVTVKSASATATISVYFADASIYSASTVTAVVADGASQFQAGRALDVVFKVTDKFGNVIATPASGLGSLSIDSTGSGYLSNTGVVRTSGTTGKYNTKLITNAGDLGTATITATLDLTTDVVRTVSSEFGVTDADVTVGGRAVYASVEFAKGKTVTVTVDGKRLYSKLQSTDNYTELKFTQKTAGKHVVTIRVSGGIVYSETVVTTK